MAASEDDEGKRDPRLCRCEGTQETTTLTCMFPASQEDMLCEHCRVSQCPTWTRENAIERHEFHLQHCTMCCPNAVPIPIPAVQW